MGTVLSGLIERMRRLRPSTTESGVEELPAFFRTHDQNRDGTVTAEELERTGGGHSLWSFLGMDTNGDAAVSLAEYKEAKARELKHANAAARWGTLAPPSQEQ